MNDIQLYVKYHTDSTYSSDNKSYKLFNSIAGLISNDMIKFVDLEPLKQECIDCFRYLHILKVLKNNKMITFDPGGDGSFKVMDHHFESIDDAVKATNNKAFL
jgi:hypothetical protein